MTTSTYVLTNGNEENPSVVTYPYSISQLQAANPNTSFPASPSNATLASFNVFPVVDTPQPTYNYMTQNLNLVNPSYSQGVWTQQWTVTAASPAEQAARLSAWRASASCTAAQGKLQLNADTIYDEAETYIAGASVEVQITWANQSIWTRNASWVETMLTALGMSATDMDTFISDAQLIDVNSPPAGING